MIPFRGMHLRLDWKRWRCDLFGCSSNEYQHCERCGVDIYDGFYEPGQLTWIFSAYYCAKNWLTPTRCDQCKSRMWSWRKHPSKWVCSKKCEQDWIPF